jgi:hypothetical protein
MEQTLDELVDTPMMMRMYREFIRDEDIEKVKVFRDQVKNEIPNHPKRVHLEQWFFQRLGE